MNLSLKLLLISFLILLFPLNSFAKTTKELPPPLNFIKWNFDKKEISKIYEGYSIDYYVSPSKMNAGDGKGKNVYGKLKSTTVKKYDWKEYFPIDINFNTIKKYKFIEIESEKKWDNCDNPEINKSTCEKEYNELKRLHEKILKKLNNIFGKEGEYYQPDDPTDKDKMHTWFVNGFEISFSLIVDYSISYVQFFIREN